MCGIAGSVNYLFDSAIVNNTMGHRGPDAQQSFVTGNIQFHHLRLSILDLTGGAQPMHYLNRYTIVFNGEIYNHQEVRKLLNLSCTTHSDTETILQAFHLLGPAMLQHFDGMFAMAIYDNVQQQLFIARDRAGKKPLYYFFDEQRLVFASELNALRALLPLQINEENLSVYLRLGSLYQSQTPYRNVTELMAGHCMQLNSVTMQMDTQCWWSIGQHYNAKTLAISEKDALDTLDSYLHTAIQRRLESSDLEVGAFLSGGIDSGLITAMAAALRPALQTFTVSFDGNFDEAPLAKLVAEKYGTRHHEIRIQFDDLPAQAEKIVAQYGEPFYDSSAIPSWYVSKAAAEHLTVILNGDGADELFGGYRRYVPFNKFNFFKTPAAWRMAARALTTCLPPGHNKKSVYNFAYRLAGLAGKQGIDTYLAATSDIFEGYKQQLCLPKNTALNNFEELYQQITHANISGLKQLLWMDFDVTLFCDLLPKMDIATMAHSLEGRSPMLCKELLEWAPTLPDEWKVQGKTTKYLLRRLAEKYLPAELIHQPKRGFEVPLKNWVNGPLQAMVNDYLHSTDTIFPALVKPLFVKKLLENKVHISAEKRAKILWTLTSLEIWYKHQKTLYRPA